MPNPQAQSDPLGVLVPCRDEARVVERKLLNLLALEWPRTGGRHRVVVVDDRSRDETVARARALEPRFAERGLELRVLANDLRPGKSAALQVGLDALAGDVGLIVLSDADVVLGGQALVHLAGAFGRDPGLGMACGAQRFVRSLCADGSLRAADGGVLQPAGELYDHVTARVRRLESLCGRLFSVHGQLLAWRATLGLAPTPGMAADDLDLMLQARLAGLRVRLVPRAEFFEVKAPQGAARADQALRRARAYLQFLEHPRMGELARHGARLERLQVALYRRGPVAAPWAAPVMMLALAVLTLGLLLAFDNLAYLFALWLVVLVLHTSLGRRLVDLLAVIRRAKLAEARAPLSDHWETPRA